MMEINLDLKQFVVSHKSFNDSRFQGRTILYVNQHLPKQEKEDTINTWSGDNIDSLNPWYCELTALYWIWKNVPSKTIISFEHYRRVFLTSHSNWFTYQFLQKNEISEILSHYDIILPLVHHFKDDLYSQYQKNHIIQDMNIMEKVLLEKHQDYSTSLKETMEGHDAVLFNMFIMKKELLDDYCSFAFPLLNEVFQIQKKDILQRNDYQQRSIGFLSERLFNIYLNKKIPKEKRFHTPIAHLDQKPFIHYIKDVFFHMIQKDYDKQWSRLK